jgi:hypothetical protein
VGKFRRVSCGATLKRGERVNWRLHEALLYQREEEDEREDNNATGRSRDTVFLLVTESFSSGVGY